MPLPQKIDEWIKEAEQRPASALSILRLIANRLVELTARDEELLAENIALQNGSQVEQYRQRITHLEFQLDLLKRRFGDAAVAAASTASQPAVTGSNNLILYHPNGRVLRLENSPQAQAPSSVLGNFKDEFAPGDELPRLLSAPSDEELLLLFTSGRISLCQLADIPLFGSGSVPAILSWQQAALPDEPHGGESLAALLPLTVLPISDYFVQVSRRGCVKKTMISLAETILSNHFVGRGTLQKADRSFEIILCQKHALLVLVTYEGRLLVLDVEQLTFTAEERLKLEPHDHVVAAFQIGVDQSLLCLTHNGKLVQRPFASLEPSRSASTRGQPLISPSRLEQGTRFVAAAALSGNEYLLVLDGVGGLSLHNWSELMGAGALPGIDAVLSFCVVPPPPPELAA